LDKFLGFSAVNGLFEVHATHLDEVVLQRGQGCYQIKEFFVHNDLVIWDGQASVVRGKIEAHQAVDAMSSQLDLQNSRRRFFLYSRRRAPDLKLGLLEHVVD
jgi:hypothetical protein